MSWPTIIRYLVAVVLPNTSFRLAGAKVLIWRLPIFASSQMEMCIRDSTSTTTNATVTQGDLIQTVSGGGAVVAARQVDLAFGPVSYTHLDVYKRQG